MDEQVAGYNGRVLLQRHRNFEKGNAGSDIPEIEAVGVYGNPLRHGKSNLKVVHRRKNGSAILSTAFDFLCSR